MQARPLLHRHITTDTVTARNVRLGNSLVYHAPHFQVFQNPDLLALKLAPRVP